MQLAIVRPPARRARRSAWMCVAAAAALAFPAAAQEPAPPAEEVSEDTQVFEASFFDVYNPNTAADMVRQVPGFAIDNGENLRGFGATAGNVLINGARPTTKNGITNELAQIPASRVARIELLRGGSNSADVRGRTSLVNVVLTEDRSASTTYWTEATLREQGRHVELRGEVTRRFKIRDIDVTVGLFAPNGLGRNLGDEQLVTPDGDVLERRERFFQENYREVILRGAASWRITPNDIVNVNSRGSGWRFHGHERADTTDAAGDPIRVELFENEETDTLFFELGGDWEHTLGPSASFKLVGLNSYWEWTGSQLFDRYSASGDVLNTIVANPGSRGERVGRGTFTWRASERLTLEAGGEVAFNFRDSNLRITEDTGSGPVAVPLQVAVTRVEELRGEAFTTAIWQILPEIKLEGGFSFEASRISQTGDAEQEREFTYPKPHAIASYDLNPQNQFRLSLTREVGQLNFQDFAASVSLNNGTQDAGNPNLEPERSWRARAEWQRQVTPRAAFTLAGFYDAVEGVQDLVVLNGFTGPGNLGDGSRWGASLQAQAPLDFTGLAGAQIKLDATYQETSVDDPVTGLTRGFSQENEWNLKANFRQDLSAQRVAWGLDYEAPGQRPFYRLNELQIFDSDGLLFGYVETTRWGGVTLRLGVQHELGQHNTRTFYQDTRATGIITSEELRDRTFGTTYQFRVTGSF